MPVSDMGIEYILLRK